MNIDRANDWGRYALMTHLARRLGSSNKFGKKAAQKVIYLLQEMARVPTGFRYTFYTYGVFSSELAAVLDAVESMGGIRAEYDPAENAYRLSAGAKADTIEERGVNFLKEHRNAIDAVISLAEGKTARTLELISTIVFVVKMEGLDSRDDEAHLVDRVMKLKPKFERSTIKQRISELRGLGSLSKLRA
jgi:uncharacterized protein YwgA